jgi:hypothetical protein
MKRRLFLSVILLLLAFAASAQCSMCKAVAETGNGGGKAGGLNDAILYLMIVPYILIFIFFRKRIFTFLKELRALWD